METTVLGQQFKKFLKKKKENLILSGHVAPQRFLVGREVVPVKTDTGGLETLAIWSEREGSLVGRG